MVITSQTVSQIEMTEMMGQLGQSRWAPANSVLEYLCARKLSEALSPLLISLEMARKKCWQWEHYH